MERKDASRYDMPVVFGPSLLPEVSTGHRAWSAHVRYLTTRDAAAELVGPWFEPADQPVVTVTGRTFIGLDWLHGRNYSLVAVSVDAVFTRGPEPIFAPFVAVIWESDTNPIVSGRELMGAPKLFAEIPEIPVGSGRDYSFGCAEYGSQLLQADLAGMIARGAADVAELNATSAESKSFFWKYIPGLRGAPDADYPTLLRQTAVFEAAWQGTGQVKFRSLTAAQAPFGARIMDRLAQLPVLEERPASATYAASMTLLRADTQRLA